MFNKSGIHILQNKFTKSTKKTSL